MKFDKNKYFKLLVERNQLKKEGKLLRDYDELLSYFIGFEDQIFWTYGEEYIQILNSFVRKKITVNQFFRQFCGLRALKKYLKYEQIITKYN
jgi:hypothetical protein